MPLPSELQYDTPGIEPEPDTQYDDQYVEYLQVNEHVETKQLQRLRQSLKDAKGMPFAELKYRNDIHEVLMHLRWVRSQLQYLQH